MQSKSRWKKREMSEWRCLAMEQVWQTFACLSGKRREMAYLNGHQGADESHSRNLSHSRTRLQAFKAFEACKRVWSLQKGTRTSSKACKPNRPNKLLLPWLALFRHSSFLPLWSKCTGKDQSQQIQVGSLLAVLSMVSVWPDQAPFTFCRNSFGGGGIGLDGGSISVLYNEI